MSDHTKKPVAAFEDLNMSVVRKNFLTNYTEKG